MLTNDVINFEQPAPVGAGGGGGGGGGGGTVNSRMQGKTCYLKRAEGLLIPNASITNPYSKR